MTSGSKQAFQAGAALLILVIGYFGFVFRAGAPLVVHLFLLGFVLFYGVRFVGGLLGPDQGTAQGSKAQGGPPAKSDMKSQDATIVDDPELGRIQLIDEEGNLLWRVGLAGSGYGVRVEMDGEDQPAPAILSTVRKLKQNMEGFSSGLRAYLAVAAANSPADLDDITNLVPESIGFLWADKPCYAEIVFGPSRSGRLWVCGYENGRFFDLSVRGS